MHIITRKTIEYVIIAFSRSLCTAVTTKVCDRLPSLISGIRSRLVTARLSSSEYQGIKKEVGTAQMMAVSFNQAQMVDFLSRDDLIHIATAGCWCQVLLMAIDMGFVKIMELLLEHGGRECCE